MITPNGLQSMNQFFKDKVYHIPNYQREYSWEDEQVEDFLLDLKELYEANGAEHFFGQIVIHNDTVSESEERLFIIDGQQRISTSVIFASVVYSIAKDLENDVRNIGGDITAEDLASDVRRDIIGLGRSNTPRVCMGNIDKVFFENYIINAQMTLDTAADKPSHKRIKNAYFKIKDFLEKELKTKQTYLEEVQLLADYYDSFAKKFKVMGISTVDLEEAFVFFETLNARGKDLETSDLLKNHLFKNCTNKLNEVDNKWNQMIEDLDGNEPTKYIRTFWNSRNPHIREKQLYKEIRSNANNEVICINLVDSLLKYAPYYRVLVNPQSNSNEFQNAEIIQILDELKALKAKTFYPLILALIGKSFSESDILRVLKSIAIIVFRNFTVCKENPNAFEKVYSEMAYSVTKGNTTSVDMLISQLTDLVVDEESFKAAFVYENISKTNARFILCKVENSKRQETETLKNNNKIHIEHIMPQSKTQWPQISDDDHKKYVDTIGNLTLLGKKLNQEASNKPFLIKRDDYYSQSEIKITKELCKYSEWNPALIVGRAEELYLEVKDFWK